MWIEKRHIFTPEERLERINQLLNPARNSATDKILSYLGMPLIETPDISHLMKDAITELPADDLTMITLLADTTRPYEEITYGKFGEPTSDR